jgi:Zn-finger nucleic acid-binding protein
VEKCPSCRGVFLDHGESEAIAERVMLAKATWEPAHQELMLAVFERMANERAQRGSEWDGGWFSD